MSDQQDVPAIGVNVHIAIDALDGTSAVTTDAAMDDAHLRRIVGAFAQRLLDGYSKLANKGVDEARALVAQGQVQLAADGLLRLGSSIMRLSRSELGTLTELGQNADVGPPTRLQLLLAAGAAYEANDERVLAREAAEKARLLAMDQGRDDSVAAALLTIANTYAREEQDHLARTTYAEVIELARREGLTDTLAWAYHNLGSLLWQAGNRQDAFLQWEREQEIRLMQDLRRRARSIAFLADKYEQFDRSEAARLYRSLVDLLENDSDAINVALRAESAYRLAVLRLEKGQWADVIKYADISIASYRPLANQEHRLAWGHQLLALAYEGQKKKRKAAAHLREKDQLLQVWGTDRDRLRNVLSSMLATRDDAGHQAALLEAEKIANALDVDARIDLYVVAAVTETQRGHGELGLEYLQEALLLEQGVMQWQDKQTPVYLHYAAAQLLSDQGKLSEVLTHATRAFALDAGNEGIVVLLAQIQLNLGLYSELEETLTALQEFGAQGNINATFINALSKVRSGDFPVAARLFGDGYRQTGRPNWKDYRDECMDVANGVITPEDGPRLAKLWRQGREPLDEHPHDPAVLVPHPRLPNVPFYTKVVQLCVDWVLRNQDVAPAFVRSFLMRQTKSLKEEDFRNLFQLVAATHFPEARGEESRTLGRSDLLLPSDDALRRRVRFEFKVWGRNDYAGVVNQLIGYMTDQEDIGVVYMVNPNKSDIAQIYRQVVVFEQPSYVSGSLRERPVRPDVTDLPHFLSIHLSPRGRRVTIYHIVHNLWT